MIIAKAVGKVRNSALDPVILNNCVLAPAKSATKTTSCKTKELIAKG